MYNVGMGLVIKVFVIRLHDFSTCGMSLVWDFIRECCAVNGRDIATDLVVLFLDRLSPR